jgi:hypothetical protein
MSTILKALRRLEDDKRAQETRSLDQAVLEPAAPVRSARGIRTRVAAGVMAAAGVIAIAWALSGFQLAPPESTPAPTPAAPANTVDRLESAAPEPEKAAPEPEKAVVYREEGRPRTITGVLARAKKPPILKAFPYKPADTSAPVEILEDPDETRRELQRGAGRPSVRVEEPELAPRDTAEPAEVVETPAPAHSPPVAVKVPRPAAVPEPPVAVIQQARTSGISVKEIFWHPTPVRRVAVFEIDGARPQRAGEGDEIAGFTIGEIGLSDVELVRDGIALKRRIGSN